MRGKKQYAWLEKYAELQQKKKPNVPKTPEKLKKEAKVFKMRKRALTNVCRSWKRMAPTTPQKSGLSCRRFLPSTSRSLTYCLRYSLQCFLFWVWECLRQYLIDSCIPPTLLGKYRSHVFRAQPPGSNELMYLCFRTFDESTFRATFCLPNEMPKNSGLLAITRGGGGALKATQNGSGP